MTHQIKCTDCGGIIASVDRGEIGPCIHGSCTACTARAETAHTHIARKLGEAEGKLANAERHLSDAQELARGRLRISDQRAADRDALRKQLAIVRKWMADHKYDSRHAESIITDLSTRLLWEGTEVTIDGKTAVVTEARKLGEEHAQVVDPPPGRLPPFYIDGAGLSIAFIQSLKADTLTEWEAAHKEGRPMVISSRVHWGKQEHTPSAGAIAVTASLFERVAQLEEGIDAHRKRLHALEHDGQERRKVRALTNRVQQLEDNRVAIKSEAHQRLTILENKLSEFRGEVDARLRDKVS